MKAILTIDMPLSCHDCPLVSEYVCLADERVGNVFEYESYCYPLCPLKEMPKEMEYEDDWNDIDVSFRQGWNACVDYLEGDGDETD